MQKTLRQLCRAEVDVGPDDRLILATDGITDNLTHDELVDIVRCAMSPDQAVEHIQTLLASRRATGILPAQLGGRFHHDDQTAICRFFSATQ
jgi:serine/threonine protein phosphatase PrpC